MTVRVALDIEGVLADIHATFLEEYNDLYGTAFTKDDITEWGFGRVHDHFIQETGYDAVSDFMNGADKVFEGFLPMSSRHWEEHHDEESDVQIQPVEEDLSEHITRVHEVLHDSYDDYTLDIVTARFGVDDSLQDWLTDHDIHEGREYDTFHTKEDKHELPYDVYIDDNPYLASALDAPEYDDRAVFLYDQPWNQHVDTSNYIRINSLAELPHYLAQEI